MTVRYPGVVLERLGASLNELWTTTPMVVVEVLSASRDEMDLNVKPAEYMGLSSLQAYIVASQDEVMCLAWLRGTDRKFRELPAEIRGAGATIMIDALGLARPLADIYRGIVEDGAPAS